ncbi:hypothetical protein RHGRI_017381 [Rhododendron griersonianum]|uniref:Receptor-like serine/threonine-protein kinase n=1 Tax=Rhododendron griersonianum TaxID=479676 RepID=A0AAV6JXM2_9ERIC|nr:hypothetical protein RHGRI_017381 [Rhododendron griersonianum]
MGKPSLRLIISFAISTTVFIYSAHLTNSQSVANLSTTWINNNPTIYINGSVLYQMTPVLSPSSASQFVSGFSCSFQDTNSCFFGIFIFGERKYFDTQNSSILQGPQPVWFANRDRPVEVNATLKLTGDGDLILEDADGDMVWSTNTRGKSVTGLRFTEFGNLVLFDSNNATVWQSFDHPMDSLLIGQKLVSNSGQKLIARASSSNFSRGLYSLSVQNGHLLGYMEANPPVVYYKFTLKANPNSKNSEKEYVVFENGTFNGQTFTHGSTAQFMRLEPDGHLKVYEWVQSEWKTMADLLTSSYFGDCGYPMVCGKYGICSSNGQCSCFAGSSNETGIFKQIDYKQTNLGCSLVTPISCNQSQYHSLFELQSTSYFNLYTNELDNKTGFEDCKNACLRNCSCKAALFMNPSSSNRTRGCMLMSEVFSLMFDDFGSSNHRIFLKVQNSPTKQSSPPIDFPRKKSRSGTIILGSSLGALFGICLLVGSCIFVFKMKREPEELDEFSVHEVSGMPTRFSYNELKTATNNFNNKLGEGGFGSVFQGTLSDGTEVAVKRLASISKIKKSFLAEVQTIGSIHHVNLVRLIGFCAENSNRLLVYEYMSNGSLDRKGEDGQLLDMVDKYNADMQLHGAEVVEMMKLAVWCLQSDYKKRPSMTVVVQVLEGFVSVQDNLNFNFINAPVRRTIATTDEDMEAIHEGTTLFASDLSGPR